MPDEFSEFPVDWAANVTVVVTYHPETDWIEVDRGALPKLFAASILGRLDDGFHWAGDPVEVLTDEDAE